MFQEQTPNRRIATVVLPILCGICVYTFRGQIGSSLGGFVDQAPRLRGNNTSETYRPDWYDPNFDGTHLEDYANFGRGGNNAPRQIKPTATATPQPVRVPTQGQREADRGQCNLGQHEVRKNTDGGPESLHDVGNNYGVSTRHLREINNFRLWEGRKLEVGECITVR